MPTLKVNEIIAYSGNTLSLGTSGNTITIPANTTFNALSGTVYIPNGIIKLDSITTSATATYNLTYGGSAYSPASATVCLVSVNGVLQTPGTAFTISGSQITFSSALNATDVINFIIVLAAPYTINAPGDGSVTNASVASNAAIAYSKLNLSNSIVNADIASSAAIATTKLGMGAVLQVVSATYSTNMTTTSGTYTDMNLSLNITPSSSSNKILILLSTAANIYLGGADAGGGINILRDATVINGGSAFTYYDINTGGAADNAIPYHVTTYDSPNTTSAITYKCQFAAYYGGYFAVHRSMPSYLIAMEIKG